MKIVLITRDRPDLTRQTIRSMQDNATHWDRHELLVVFDGTSKEQHEMFGEYGIRPGDPHFFHLAHQTGVGGAKNWGIRRHDIQEAFQPDDLIMFSDNDMYYLKDWDSRLENAFHPTVVTQLGGWKHPYHQIEGFVENLDVEGREAVVGVGAVTGN